MLRSRPRAGQTRLCPQGTGAERQGGSSQGLPNTGPQTGGLPRGELILARSQRTRRVQSCVLSELWGGPRTVFPVGLQPLTPAPASVCTGLCAKLLASSESWPWGAAPALLQSSVRPHPDLFPKKVPFPGAGLRSPGRPSGDATRATAEANRGQESLRTRPPPSSSGPSLSAPQDGRGISEGGRELTRGGGWSGCLWEHAPHHTPLPSPSPGTAAFLPPG